MQFKLFHFFRRNTNPLIVAILSIAVFILRFGIKPLNIFETNWIKNLGSDFGNEINLWYYFLHSPWTFPITSVGYDYPTVIGVGMTGSIPILSIPLKLVYNIFPINFQHLGWWFALCYVLQGLYAYKILNLWVDKLPKDIVKNNNFDIIPIVGALFFVVAPTLLFRWGHIDMNAHFLILIGLYYYFNTNKSPRKNLIALIVLCLITAAVQQYLLLMVLGIAFAGGLQNLISRKINFGGFTAFLAILLIGVFFVLDSVGDFILPVTAQQNDGFGKYSANLNTFWNPLNSSKFIKTQPLAFSDQYEGFGYLGIGVLLLAGISVASLIFMKSVRKRYAFKFSSIVFVSLLIFIFALSKNITFNSKVLLEIPVKDYTALGIFCNSFRGSGRFIWVPYYLIMIGIFEVFVNLPIKNYLKIILLLFFLALQMFELQSLFALNLNHNAVETAFPSEVEKHIYDEAEKLITYPLYCWNVKTSGDFYKFAYHTSELGLPITTGYLARPDYKARGDWAKKFNAALDSGALFDAHNAIVIPQMSEVGRFDKVCKLGLLKSFVCNGYAILVPPNLKNTISFLEHNKDVQPLKFHTEFFSDFLKRHTNNTVLLAVSDEAANKLSDSEKKYLTSIGSHIADSLRFQGSFIGIIHKGKTIFEQFANGKIVEHNFLKNEKIGAFSLPENIYLMSKGTFAGIDCAIKIAGIEYTHRNQGFNCVAIDAQGNVVEKCVFNTYLSSERAVFE